MLTILHFLLLVLAISPLAYYLLSFYCVIEYFLRLRRAPVDKGLFLPPVSILKPVRGVDHEAYENFASFCRLDYPEYEIVFAVADKDQLFSLFDSYEAECKRLIGRKLPLPAYDFALKCSHTFNLLDARGAISVTERHLYVTIGDATIEGDVVRHSIAVG